MASHDEIQAEALGVEVIDCAGSTCRRPTRARCSAIQKVRACLEVQVPGGGGGQAATVNRGGMDQDEGKVAVIG